MKLAVAFLAFASTVFSPVLSLVQDEEDTLLQLQVMQSTEGTARTMKIGVGDHNQGADPVDACKNSDGFSIKQLDSRMKEDCTDKDFHIWHSNIKRAPTYKPGEYAVDDAWRTVKFQEEDGWQSSCVAYVETDKTSCTAWCDVHGLQCVKAMDNAAGRAANLWTWFKAADYNVSQCSLGKHWEAGKMADITGYASTHGCNLPLNSQICACDTTTTTTVEALFFRQVHGRCAREIDNVQDCNNAVKWLAENEVNPPRSWRTDIQIFEKSWANWPSGCILVEYDFLFGGYQQRVVFNVVGRDCGVKTWQCICATPPGIITPTTSL